VLQNAVRTPRRAVNLEAMDEESRRTDEQNGSTSGAPTGEPTARPTLRRSKGDRIIAGVCGGVGHYFGIDPILVRLAFAVLVLAGLSGILLYILAWIVIPEEDAAGSAGRASTSSSNAAGLVIGAVLVAAGAIMLLERVWPRFDDVLWPVALIGIGAAVILQGTRRR
jgi:phage shock protein C